MNIQELREKLRLSFADAIADTSLMNVIMSICMEDYYNAFIEAVALCRGFGIDIDNAYMLYEKANTILEAMEKGVSAYPIIRHNLKVLMKLKVEPWTDIPTAVSIAILTTYQLLYLAWLKLITALVEIVEELDFQISENMLFDTQYSLMGIRASKTDLDNAYLSGIVIYSLLARHPLSELLELLFKALAYKDIASTNARESFLAQKMYNQTMLQLRLLFAEVTRTYFIEVEREYRLKYEWATKPKYLVKLMSKAKELKEEGKSLLYEGKFPKPFLEIPRRYWGSGKPVIHGVIEIRQASLPILFRDEQPVTTLIVSPRGGGKTVTLTSISVYAVDRGYTVINFSIDPREQTLLNQLPMLESHPAYKLLTEFYRIKPKPVKVKSIRWSKDIYPKVESDIDYDLNSMDWEQLWSGVTSEPGIVMFRYHAGIAGVLVEAIRAFMNWRRKNKEKRVLVVIDEVQEVAGSRIFANEKEKYYLMGVIEEFIRHARGLGLPLVYSTQRPYSISPILRAEATYIMMGAFKEEQDRKALLKLLPRHPDLRVIENLLTHHMITMHKDYKWMILYDSVKEEFTVVKAISPPCMIEQAGKSPYKILEQHGKIVEHSPKRLLQKQVDQVTTEKKIIKVIETCSQTE